LQKTFIAARKDAGITKDAPIHTLRHSYVTHLLESGISLRTIQQVLGHKSMRTTELYMHLTQPGSEHLQEIVDRLMAYYANRDTSDNLAGAKTSRDSAALRLWVGGRSSGIRCEGRVASSGAARRVAGTAIARAIRATLIGTCVRTHRANARGLRRRAGRVQLIFERRVPVP
jgi:hypothetical protein